MGIGIMRGGTNTGVGTTVAVAIAGRELGITLETNIPMATAGESLSTREISGVMGMILLILYRNLRANRVRMSSR